MELDIFTSVKCVLITFVGNSELVLSKKRYGREMGMMISNLNMLIQVNHEKLKGRTNNILYLNSDWNVDIHVADINKNEIISL